MVLCTTRTPSAGAHSALHSENNGGGGGFIYSETKRSEPVVIWRQRVVSLILRKHLYGLGKDGTL